MNILVSDPNFIKVIPKLPGVYRFYAIREVKNCGDKQDEYGDYELLYVGKALNLYNRVKSYFQKSNNLSPRISLMVAKVHSIEITVTENEVSALILENNLIKSLKPKYNIIFRDDKSYPLIRLSKHEFPRLDSFRKKMDAGNLSDNLFGPYPNSFAVKQNLDLIGKLFKLRNCTDAVFSSRTRPCIMYEIKRCSAPCVHLVSKADYAVQVALAIDFLKGKYASVLDSLTAQMYQLSDHMEFEKAAVVRDRLNQIKHISSSQIINSYNQPMSADLIICRGDEAKVFIYLIILRNGLYVGDKSFILDNLDDDVSQVVEAFLENYYLGSTHNAISEAANTSYNYNAQGIFTKFSLRDEFKQLFFKACNIKISQGRYKQIKKLYQMGEVNLRNIINQYQGMHYFNNAAGYLANLLNLNEIKRIECIDVSHHQGDNTVASIVVYENGVIDHSKYRRYNLATDLSGRPVGGNDLLAMQTVLERRLQNKELKLPDVILVDGGQLQLDILKNILKNAKLYDRMRGLAIFKGERRDPTLDRVLVDNGDVLGYANHPLLFRLLQGLRDEAHRFAITGHRKRQVKKMSQSQLDDIPNLGIKKKKALLAHFGSVKSIMNAGVADLQNVVGIGSVLAEHIYRYFH
ncbi:MAG: excinuclease subunit [Pseudomonadota bacterium]|nr:excinuclease subunit [Pseudomonadota bacterium]